jgi:hypothetical protein
VASHHVFLSRPTEITRAQQTFCKSLEDVLVKNGLTTHTVGATDFTSRVPLRKVLEVMTGCDGACILGLVQARAARLVTKPGTRAEQTTATAVFPTPWNQLEAGLAVALGLPLLVLCEPGITGGIFDRGVGDAFIHELPPERRVRWLASPQFEQSIAEWLDLMNRRLPARP